MSVIAVQSAVGHHVIDTQPAEARQALAAIEATSRSALTEMRRLLGVLRQEGEPRGSLAPAPGLADLATLVEQVKDAGLKVSINVDGERGTGPPGVDLSAYRIIQEALTNVIKHAAASTASVRVSYAADSVTVEVTDLGPDAAPAAVPAPRTGSGHGIIGMRERVAVFGGEFAAGPGPAGWRLRMGGCSRSVDGAPRSRRSGPAGPWSFSPSEDPRGPKACATSWPRRSTPAFRSSGWSAPPSTRWASVIIRASLRW